MILLSHELVMVTADTCVQIDIQMILGGGGGAGGGS